MDVYCLTAGAHPKSFGSFIRGLQDKGKEQKLAPHMAKILHLAQHGGHPMPPHAKPLRHVDGELNEICSKLNEKELLRIYYFVDREKQKMVLMNISIKPDLYEGTLKKRVEKELQADIEEALHIKSKYSTSPNDYEQI